LKSACVV
jgi:hypothetical protein